MTRKYRLLEIINYWHNLTEGNQIAKCVLELPKCHCIIEVSA